MTATTTLQYHRKVVAPDPPGALGASIKGVVTRRLPGGAMLLALDATRFAYVCPDDERVAAILGAFPPGMRVSIKGYTPGTLLTNPWIDDGQGRSRREYRAFGVRRVA